MPRRLQFLNGIRDGIQKLFQPPSTTQKPKNNPLLQAVYDGIETRPDQQEIVNHLKRCSCPLWIWLDGTGITKGVKDCLQVAFEPGLTTSHLLKRGFRTTVAACQKDQDTFDWSGEAEILRGDFHSLPQRSDTMDILFAEHVISHSYAPLLALIEWQRVVKPGGYIVVTLPLAVEGCLSSRGREAFVADGLPNRALDDTVSADLIARHYTCGIPQHFFVFTYWQAIHLFLKADLELVEAKIEDIQERKLYDYSQIAKSLRTSSRSRTGLFLLRKKEETMQRKTAAAPVKIEKKHRGDRVMPENRTIILAIHPDKTSYTSLEESLKFHIEIKNQTRNKITTNLWAYLMKGEKQRAIPAPIFGPQKVTVKPKRTVTIRCYRTLHYPLKSENRFQSNNRYALLVQAGNFPTMNWSALSETIRIGKR